MPVFKSRAFDRYARRAGLEDATLLAAAREVRAGQHDGDLGAGVFKKRIARPGAGKSGGYRTLLICSHADLTVFEYGFAKSDRGNINAAELSALKKLASDYRKWTLAAARRQMIEVTSDEA